MRVKRSLWLGRLLIAWVVSCAAIPALARVRRCGGDCGGSKDQTSLRPHLQPAEYRQFALENDGDATRGKALFNEVRISCFRCHSVDGSASTVGPDLLGTADKYPRHGLIQSILEPSSSILPGYSTTIVRTRSGQTHHGVLRQLSDLEIELHNAGAARVRIPVAEIKERRTSAISSMPTGLQEALSLQEFADLIAYLETLKQPAVAGVTGAATPDVIPRLANAIDVRPFHSAHLRFDHPVWFGPLPGADTVFVVLEHQRARIWLLEKNAAGERKSLFADFDDEVSNGPFEGLMCIAFHPKFEQNRKYYLKHEVVEDKQRSTVVVEKRASADFRKDAGLPSRRLLKIDQPAENHNGGTIAFGPDGYLYIGMGDGGPQEDPLGRSQSAAQLLGKMLRIDVDRLDSGKPYGIPRSNPFIRHPEPGARPEVWAAGLREPWRFTFDKKTGDLWVGDVGQTRFEEVTIVRAGENHGWNVYEGFEPFSSRYRREGTAYVPPVVSLVRKHGVSVTGGYVYRGNKSSSFHGVYIFGDFESRRIWGLTQEGRKLTKIREIGRSPARIASFGEDDGGGLYLVGYDDGIIYQLHLEATLFN